MLKPSSGLHDLGEIQNCGVHCIGDGIMRGPGAPITCISAPAWMVSAPKQFISQASVNTPEDCYWCSNASAQPPTGIPHRGVEELIITSSLRSGNARLAKLE